MGFFSLLLVFCFASVAYSQCPMRHYVRDYLTKFHNQTSGWITDMGWGTDEMCSYWYGVYASGYTDCRSPWMLMSINLPFNGMNGTLDSLAGLLGFFGTGVDIYFPGNYLYGHVPKLWDSSGSPNSVDLSQNYFTSMEPIPDLKGFSISYNKIRMNFEDILGPTVDHLFFMDSFNISHNQFYGELTSEYLKKKGFGWLEYGFDISHNSLSGPVPDIFKDEETFKNFFSHWGEIDWDISFNDWDLPVPEWCSAKGNGKCISSKNPVL